MAEVIQTALSQLGDRLVRWPSNRSRLRRAVLVVVAAVMTAVCLPKRPALAQEEPEALIRQGVELRRKGQNALAQGYFKRAYAIAHTPRSAAQLGLVEHALGYYLDAEQHLGEALDNADTWVEQQRAILEQSRQAVRAHLARVEVRGMPPGATVRVAGRPAARVAADGSVWVPPGPLTLDFAAPGCAPVSKDVSASEGATLSLDVELRPAVPSASAPPTAPAPPPGSAPSPSPPPAPAAAPAHPEAGADLRSEGRGGKRTARLAGVVVAGAGVALVAGGLITYLAGSSKLDAISRDAAAGNPYNTGNGNYQALGNLGAGVMIAGVASMATGAALYLLNRSPGGEAGASRLSLGYLPGAGAQVQLGGRF
jgi:hypothetical protein